MPVERVRVQIIAHRTPRRHAARLRTAAVARLARVAAVKLTPKHMLEATTSNWSVQQPAEHSSSAACILGNSLVESTRVQSAEVRQ